MMDAETRRYIDEQISKLKTYVARLIQKKG